jgi:peroxiredoxin Q/BCP
MLKEQSLAPAFTLSDAHLAQHSLTDYSGKFVLLYFYPKDDTPGCTIEACTFRDLSSELTQAGLVVLGMSKDSPESHRAFAEKYNLPFTLLSDPQGTVIQSYDAWGEKTFMGKKSIGVLRVSYLIDPNGCIAKAYPQVQPAEHPAEVLRDLHEISKNW